MRVLPTQGIVPRGVPRKECRGAGVCVRVVGVGGGWSWGGDDGW